MVWAARQVREHVAELVTDGRAEVVAAELDSLIEAGADDEARLDRVLAGYDHVWTWLNERLGDRPAVWRKYVDPSPGDFGDIDALVYQCPAGHRWVRLGVGTPVPACAEQGCGQPLSRA